MNPDETARQALARLITERREDFSGLSRLIGRNAAYVQQYIKRGVPRRLAEEDRRKLARYFQVEESLLGGIGSSDPTQARLVPVQRYEVQASAGHGSNIDDGRALAPMAFDQAWLKRLCDAPAEALSIIRVQGDSMNPTLSDGDEIMVDRSDARLRVLDGIYVLRRDETLMVKRIAVHPGSRLLTITSDNHAYPSWTDCEPESVDIIGRVVWVGRKLS